jgi:HD-GYP domain-containing protein (c-di-GMP phosphodiesterase class II)
MVWQARPFLPLARIVAVADAFNAMTSDRRYRKGMPLEVAFAELSKQSGLQFDPDCAVAFLELREQIVQELQTDTANLSTFVNPKPALVAG